MKLGVFSVLLADRSLDEALGHLAGLGVEMVEIGTAGYPGNAHANPEVLLNDDKALEEFKATLERHKIQISALSCHGNPVHPQKALAEEFHKGFEQTILLAEKLGITQINTFSGCPGDSEGSKYPNWVTCSWPDDYMTILEYQWNEVLIPYWKKAAAFAKAHGVDKIAIEMHPGFCVYNPDTLLRLRNAVGQEIGANFDPSHLYWQGMDPVAAIEALGEAIFHFHAKDTKIHPYNVAKSGVLDIKHYSETNKRSWLFRTVGYGHDALAWKGIMSALRSVGYDYAISIEHEDSMMGIEEGLESAVRFLQGVLLKEKPSAMWWA
ncbi:sugar phosphate isomerase/epimerase family protein [Anaerotalea alkaliphila]|uniref:Sugar phosphate isomerase/epimerase n=1 Tax=Anaerotalea alkaliphila TaxID=2662126 RepID=A0A7X5KLZ5_9FIRM|nr:sugar phosphate isomerase/epimerase [Anaerotalea alkaliphila]NDL67396.1 sugar phosphate isomerase/epimerase [Anaerotalea alkaliphila]